MTLAFEHNRRRLVGRKHASGVGRFFLENGLSLTLIALFVGCLISQMFAGWRAYNNAQSDHGQPRVKLVQYWGTSHFWEALSENWESEFLQLAAFVWLTSILYQKGSPESKDPYEPENDPPVTPQSPWPCHKGGWVLRLYEYSMTLTLLGLFAIAFAIHVISGTRLYNEEQIQHGQETVSYLGYLVTSQLWFESFQNWQSEFLSIAVMVILSIFLRQKGSQESKPVQTPHHENE